MKKVITVYVCDFKQCDKEIKGINDGLVIGGALCTADGGIRLGGNEQDPYAICWEHFHEKFPSPQIRMYKEQIDRSYDRYERGGPNDR